MRTVKALNTGYPQVIRLAVGSLQASVIGSNWNLHALTTERHRLTAGDKVKFEGAVFANKLARDWVNNNLLVVSSISDEHEFNAVIPSTGLADPGLITITNATCQKFLDTNQYDPFCLVNPVGGGLAVEASGMDAGLFGADVYADTTQHTGNWGRVVVLSAAVFTMGSSATICSINGLTGVTIPALTELRGEFTAIKLASGTVLAYRNGKGADLINLPLYP